jgi:hypothetical protein
MECGKFTQARLALSFEELLPFRIHPSAPNLYVAALVHRLHM